MSLTQTASTQSAKPQAANTDIARKAMIDSQLRTSGVNEEFALGRMNAVPREAFLPQDKASLAYIDRSISIGPDAHLAAPLFYGKVLLEAAPTQSDRVLIVSGGTDYLAELVRPLAGDVTVVSAADATAKNVAGSGALKDTYSMILIDGAIEALPENLRDALEEEGTIVSGVVSRGVTRLATGRKIAGHLPLEPIEDMGIPVLHAFDQAKKWTFS